jgi:hypothetical protein
MKVRSRGFLRHAVVLFILLVPASSLAVEIQKSQNARQAEALWEEALAARGGREQIARVNSLLISYRVTVRNFLGVVIHRGAVETLYVFPDKMWGWDDGLPPPFHLTVKVLDLAKGRSCTLYQGNSAPVCGQARLGDEGAIQAQLLYLMETRWVKPIPVGVSEDRIGLRKVDVLHTHFQDNRIDYFLDPKTHLPARVSIFYGAAARSAMSVEFSEYARVGGLMMPGKKKRGKINFEMNPAYDESIFSRLPSIEAGPKAWQRSSH